MKRSTELVLTTHTGSLPRPHELLDGVHRTGLLPRCRRRARRHRQSSGGGRGLRSRGRLHDRGIARRDLGVSTHQHYASHEEYIGALADVMKQEYDEIHRAGLVLQLDCPDLAMTRHMDSDESLDEFRRRARLHVEANNPRHSRHSG